MGVESLVSLALFALRPRKAAIVDPQSIRIFIRRKLADGRLPHDGIPRVWGGAGAGETCDGCEDSINKTQFIFEGGVSTSQRGVAIQMHVACFKMWDEERVVPGRSQGSR